MAYPRLSIPLSKAGMIIGTGSSRAHPLHILPHSPKYRLGKVDWVAQLHSLRGSVPGCNGLPSELLHRVLPL